MAGRAVVEVAVEAGKAVVAGKEAEAAAAAAAVVGKV